MPRFLKYGFQFALLILIQALVLDKVQLHHWITPYIYFAFILWLPFDISRPMLLILAFVLGLTVDSFRQHPGFHAAACVLIAYVRPLLISLLLTKEAAESNYESPSIKSMGGIIPYLFYAGVLVFLHNAWLFLLQAWQFADLWYFLSKTVFSTILSLFLLISIEFLFGRNQKFRTNTA